jgi:hypothetical protein
MRVTAKERARACNGYTITVRPWTGGLRRVAVVDLLADPPEEVFRASVVEPWRVADAVRGELRMLAKCGTRCAMATASRHRGRT